MSELELKIYEHFQENRQYNYSEDIAIRSAEMEAVKNLELTGYISVKARAIGFCIADVL